MAQPMDAFVGRHRCHIRETQPAQRSDVDLPPSANDKAGSRKKSWLPAHLTNRFHYGYSPKARSMNTAISARVVLLSGQ
jgi:hypothetical protein